MYFAFELYLLFILGFVRWDDGWRGGRGRGTTHAVRSVPFRQTGLASGFQVSATKTLTIGDVGDGATHCRFWIRMKDSTICTIVRRTC